MKKITYLLVLLSFVGYAQKEEFGTDHIAESEMRSAAKRMELLVNPNTQNYDVTYSKLEFTVDPAVYNINGIVTTTFKALSNMSTVTFDFYKTTTNPFTISSVKINGTVAPFVHNATHELVITLPSTLTTGNSAIAEIIYSGAPSTGEQAFTTGTHGASTPVLYTLSEPYGARDWWPCKQDLNDKIDSIDVYITAPSQYVSVSNGIEPSAPITVGANKTTHFHHGHPIAAYLVAIAVTNYQVYNQQAGLGTVASPFYPIINYIYPETAATNIANLAVTPNIINFYETIIGPYAFRDEKYGHAQFGWGGGMEHTTVSFMGGFQRDLISHEMGHQWFGDKITCGSWKDIWLNEGITEYMSGCVVENFDGPASFITWKTNKINSVTSAATGNLYLYDADLTNVNRIFSSRLTYNKGCMVTNMLRYMMGDANFFQALRNYLSDPLLAYNYALTPQFQAKLEQLYGSSLQEFFNDWVYKEGYPIYTITASNTGINQATVQINQSQSITNAAQVGYVSFFEMPVPVRLNLSNGTNLDVKLNNTFSGQTFVVNLPAGTTATGVLFDPNKDIISKNSTATLGTTAFNLENAFYLFPNPVNDLLTIETPSQTAIENVFFYNILGQKSLESNTTKIDVSSLPTGVYTVIIKTSEGSILKKLLKN